jgi:hypothetical protein
MRPIPYIILFLFSAVLTRAQQVLDVTKIEYNQASSNGNITMSANGVLSSPVKFIRVTSGTPYFIENWTKGTLVLEGGKAYANLSLRLDLMNNEVEYKDMKGQEMTATSPIQYIFLTDSITGVKYDFVRGAQLGIGDKLLSKTFFQILVNGKVSLLRQISKKSQESITYGSATQEVTIVTINAWYVRMNGNLSRFKWDDWQEIFKDKKDSLSAFIKTNHLKGKSEEDFTKLVTYYNTFNTL